MQPCVLCNSLWKNAVLALIGALLSLGIILSGAVTWMPWGFLLFGAVAVLLGYRTFDRRPRVIIDESGIADLRNSVGLIRWSDISEATVAPGAVAGCIYVTVRNPDKWRAKLPVAYRLFWRYFQKRRVINIPLQNMSVADGVARDCLAKWLTRSGESRTTDSANQ